MEDEDSDVLTDVDDGLKVILQTSSNNEFDDTDPVPGDKKGIPTLPTGPPLDSMEEDNSQKNNSSSSSSSSSKNDDLLLSSKNDSLRRSTRPNLGKIRGKLYLNSPNIVSKAHELSVPGEKVSVYGNYTNKNDHENNSSSSSTHGPEIIDAVFDAEESASQEANQKSEEQNFSEEQLTDAQPNKTKRGRPVKFPKPVGQY